MHPCVSSFSVEDYIFVHVDVHTCKLYCKVLKFDFVVLVHILLSIHLVYQILQEPRPILFEIKKAWSRFLLETFKYQIHVSIFNVFNFVYMYNAKEDTCISTVSQHLIAVVLSEMRNNRN